MCIRDRIDAETESSDVELLWASASGSGYDSGAVGSPILVDGYMYAYAGTKLLKLDCLLYTSRGV